MSGVFPFEFQLQSNNAIYSRMKIRLVKRIITAINTFWLVIRLQSPRVVVLTIFVMFGLLRDTTFSEIIVIHV